MITGCLLLAAGAAGTVAAVAAGSAAGFFAGTAFTGTGFGLAFLGVFRTLVALAPPQGRAGLIIAIYLVSYLAFSLPVTAAGHLLRAGPPRPRRAAQRMPAAGRCPVTARSACPQPADPAPNAARGTARSPGHRLPQGREGTSRP
jgi:hypothetical protein